jgi:hypothetical protein
MKTEYKCRHGISVYGGFWDRLRLRFDCIFMTDYFYKLGRGSCYVDMHQYIKKVGAKMSEALRSSSSDPIYLNPSFGEVVMGFPEGWTLISKRSALRLLETRSSHKSPSSSQGASKS